MHMLSVSQKALRALASRLGRVPARAAGLAVALCVAAYGAFAFAKLDFAGYISMQTRFAFIDPSQSVTLFVFEHFTVFALFALVGLVLTALTTKKTLGRTKG